MRVLVTGATGFVGHHLMNQLRDVHGMEPVAGVRTSTEETSAGDSLVLGTIGIDPPPALTGMDAIVHCAARVHVMRDDSADPLTEFRRVNVDGTLALAEQAVRDNVKRFVFLSSVKVNGEATALGRPFTPGDPSAPLDPYGVSKFEAEQALQQLARRTGLELVIIRPVLVYGPGVKGNFRSMLRWLDKGIPLPLGAVQNRRSLVSVANLCDLIAQSLIHHNAPGKTFFAADASSLSTTSLLEQLSHHLGKRPRLFSVPQLLLAPLLGAVGFSAQFDRLFGTLEVDITANREEVGWTPPQSTSDGLRDTAAWFLRHG